MQLSILIYNISIDRKFMHISRQSVYIVQCFRSIIKNLDLFLRWIFIQIKNIRFSIIIWIQFFLSKVYSINSYSLHFGYSIKDKQYKGSDFFIFIFMIYKVLQISQSINKFIFLFKQSYALIDRSFSRNRSYKPKVKGAHVY